jgi:single-stranded-DNA-specific exonuclease
VIEKMSPFGVGNPKPVFILKNEEIYSIKEFGKDKNHLEITFKNSN